MKLFYIFVILTLSEIVKGAWWTAMQPIALSFGTLLTAINLAPEMVYLEFWWPFRNKKGTNDKDKKSSS